MAVLEPGVTKRRWEPEEGTRKLNKRIHKESKFADDHKNLPFTFSKPSKPRGRTMYVSCDNCNYIASATTVTIAMVCTGCKSFSTVSEVVDEQEK